MSETVARRKVTVTNPQGLHLRPAYVFVELASKFDASVQLIKNGERVDGKSILSIATLAIEQGTEVEIETAGHDAEAAVAALVKLVEQNFPGGTAADAAEQNS